MQNIEDRIKQIIGMQFGIPRQDVDLSKNIADEPMHADSLDAIEIVMALEEEFNIQISNEEAEKAQTGQQIVDLVTQLARKH